MAIEFEVGTETYRAGKLDAFAQLHVSRKIAPVLPKLLPILALLPKTGDAVDLGQMGAILEPLTGVLAAMPKDDVDLVVTACLSVVQRKQGATWAPVWRSGTLMFEDIELAVLVQVVVQVIRGSLGNFMQGFRSVEAVPGPNPTE
jgi:hypothetical protein